MSADVGLPRISSESNIQCDKDIRASSTRNVGCGESVTDSPVLESTTTRSHQGSDAHSGVPGRHAMANQPGGFARVVGYQGTHAARASTKQSPSVSIVIPCRDDERTIRTCILSTLNQDYPNLKEIILIGSPIDTTWEALTGIYDRRLVIQEVHTPSGIDDTSFKFDFGMRESSSELVCLVDPKMVLSRDWLSKAITALHERVDPPSGFMPSTNRGFRARTMECGARSVESSRVERVRKWNIDPPGHSLDADGNAVRGQLSQGAHNVHPAEDRTAPTSGMDLLTHARPSNRGEGSVAGATRSLHVHTDPSRFAEPPSDAEKYRYIKGSQKRWFVVIQYLAFLGVFVSFAGFATSTYVTLIFSIPLLMFAIEQTLALYTSTRRRRIDVTSHRHVAENWNPHRFPSVDVFVPTAGEELEVLDNTMRYLSLLRWPGDLRVSVLDDSGRIEVRRLAAKYGFSYLARPGSKFKKAGNLRYGAEHTNGEIIAIFDADFVPRPEFLFSLFPTWTIPESELCRVLSSSIPQNR